MGFEPGWNPTPEQDECLGLLAQRISAELEQRFQSDLRRARDERRFYFLAEEVEDLIAVVDPSGRRLYGNRAYEKLLGDPAASRGTDPFLDVHPDDRQAVQDLLAAAIQTRRGGRARYRVIAKDGSTRHLESHNTPVLGSSGEVSEIIVAARDVTDRAEIERATERHIEELNRRSRELSSLTAMADVVHRCNSFDDIVKGFVEHRDDLFPSSDGSVYVFDPEQERFGEVYKWHEEARSDPHFQKDQCWAVTGGKGWHQVEEPDLSTARICQHVRRPLTPYLCVHAAGKGRAEVVLHLRLLPEPSPNSRPEGRRRWMHAQRDLAIAAAKHLALAVDSLWQREKLQREATQDELTGLFNRNHMVAMLQREVANCTRTGRSLGLIMADIDHFKGINSKYTHIGGDYVIREIGSFLAGHVRGSDLVCRYGGEEFLLIMPEASESGLVQKAEQLRQGAKALNLQFQGKPIKVSLSIGVAVMASEPGRAAEIRRATEGTFRVVKTRLDELTQSVADALREAKRQGRDRVVLWTGAQSQTVH
jgi:diguanylate cyclase (GGDEF)-like protein/PAS domain S-box-containing protein